GGEVLVGGGDQFGGADALMDETHEVSAGHDPALELIIHVIDRAAIFDRKKFGVKGATVQKKAVGLQARRFRWRSHRTSWVQKPIWRVWRAGWVLPTWSTSLNQTR